MIKSRKIRPVYLYFFAVLLAAALILNILYMLYYARNERKTAELERKRILSQTVYSFDRYLEEIGMIADTISLSEQSQKLLAYRMQINYMDYRKCADLISGSASVSSGIYRIDYYIRNTKTLLTSNEGVFYDLADDDCGFYEEWMDRDLKSEWDISYGSRYPSVVSSFRNGGSVTLLKQVNSITAGKKAGMLCVGISPGALAGLSDIGRNEGESLTIKNGDSVFLSAGTADPRARSMTEMSSATGLTFIYSYPQPAWTGDIFQVVLVTLLILLVFSGIFSVLVGISEKKMFYPVAELLHAFGETEKGNFDYRLDENRNDMFRDINVHYNHMAGKISELINELSDERIRRNELKFRLLQMQIKPHFLYNLFNNMIWMVEQKDYANLEMLIESTAGYYKTALNYGQKDIFLSDCMKQLEYYSTIQEIRFPDAFTTEISFDKEILNLTVPNLILQPLLENSITHALKRDGKKKMRILISGRTEKGFLILEVRDDGKGIDPDMLSDIRKELKNCSEDGKKYFALTNIENRLKNKYGDRSGLAVESEYGKWTRVTIRIPLEGEQTCTG
jgi:two-component system sensor histidine kinase YesM